MQALDKKFNFLLCLSQNLTTGIVTQNTGMVTFAKASAKQYQNKNNKNKVKIIVTKTSFGFLFHTFANVKFV